MPRPKLKLYADTFSATPNVRRPSYPVKSPGNHRVVVTNLPLNMDTINDGYTS